MNNTEQIVITFDLDKNTTLCDHINIAKQANQVYKQSTAQQPLIFYIIHAGDIKYYDYYFLTNYLSTLNSDAEFLFRGVLTRRLYDGITNKSKINIFDGTLLFDDTLRKNINVL